MLKQFKMPLFVLSIAGALCPPDARAAPPPPLSAQDQNVRPLIHGMRDAGTWGHPDQVGQYKGMAAFSDGRYPKARYLFRIGARDADKVSQLSIGLMYLNGQGVTRDPVQAWAWVALSAERGTPGSQPPGTGSG